MSNKIKLTIKTVLVPDFAPSFDKLADETSVPMKDRYAISRTLASIRQAVSAYDEQRVKLVKEMGKPELEVLKEQALKAVGSAREAALKTRVEQLEKSGEKSWTIDPADAETLAAFRAKIDELQAVEFEVYLDHAVALTDLCKLSAKDMAALGELVTVV